MQREARLSNIVLAATAALSLALLLLPVQSSVLSLKLLLSYCFQPAPLAVLEGVSWARQVPSNVLGLLRVDQENRALREDIKRVELLRAEVQQLSAENARMRGLLGLEVPEGFAPVWAPVLYRDPARWYGSVVLGKGSDDGIELNSAVLAPAAGLLGVVGRISEVSPRSSKVLLLTDDLSSVASAVGEGEGWACLAEGMGGPYLRLNYVSELADLRLGQRVLTSATSPTFPPGLPVGRVLEVLPSDPFIAMKSAKVELAVPVGRLRELMVLSRKRGSS